MAEERPCCGRRDVVAIGASAGGLHALSVVLSGLPADLPAVVMVVQHLAPKHESHMAEILSKTCPMPVVQAVDGQTVRKSTVYFAPPAKHMLVEDGRIHLTATELVHFVRPSVDLLLESVAAVYGERVMGVILTGSGMDGAHGIEAVKDKGGLTMAQDPATAESPGMPSAAIATQAIDLVVPLEEIAEAIVKAVTQEEWCDRDQH